MGSAPDLFVQVIWEGFVAGTLYALIALGFVLIFKASGIHILVGNGIPTVILGNSYHRKMPADEKNKFTALARL